MNLYNGWLQSVLSSCVPLLLLLHVGDGGYSALHSGTVTQLVGGGQKAGSDAGVDMSGTPGLAAMTGVCVCVRACVHACMYVHGLTCMLFCTDAYIPEWLGIDIILIPSWTTLAWGVDRGH